MNKFSLISAQKRGQAGVGNKINYLIGALVVIVLAVALAPEMFSGIAELENETLNPSVPAWLPTTLYVVIAAGVLFLIWRAFGGSK
jgi:hypothetical protein